MAETNCPTSKMKGRLFQTIRNSRKLVALLLGVALTGCVEAALRPAAQPAAPLPGPGHLLVYDFGATACEIKLYRGSVGNDLG